MRTFMSAFTCEIFTTALTSVTAGLVAGSAQQKRTYARTSGRSRRYREVREHAHCVDL